MNRLWLLIMFLYLPSQVHNAFALDTQDIRIRILEKYHPASLLVSSWESPDETVLINKKSAFPVEFRSGRFHVHIPDSSVDREYPGTLMIEWDEEELLVINIIPLESYVTSVVLSEMGWTASEAMRAQAVLSRTWAITHRRKSHMYDFDDLTHSQVYKGLFPQTNAVADILSETSGGILVYSDEPVEVLYHAGCSDRIFSAHEIWGVKHIPYLTKGNLPEILKKRKKSNIWKRTLKKSDVDALFRTPAQTKAPVTYRKTQRQGQLGLYVNDKWIGIDDFRLAVNRALGWNQLRSNDFTMKICDNLIIFNGRGFGHLAGLCQQEAVVLAENGYDYLDILSLFYPGCHIKDYNSQTD